MTVRLLAGYLYQIFNIKLSHKDFARLGKIVKDYDTVLIYEVLLDLINNRDKYHNHKNPVSLLQWQLSTYKNENDVSNLLNDIGLQVL